MKFALLFACFVGSMLVNGSPVPSASNAPSLTLTDGPLGGGLTGALGPAGIPGLPFLPPVLPNPVPVPPVRPLFGARQGLLWTSSMLSPFFGPFGGLFLGKRDVEDMQKRLDAESSIQEDQENVVRKAIEKLMESSKLSEEQQQEEKKLAEKSVSEVVVEKSSEVVEPSTVCSVSSVDGMLRCDAPSLKMECRVRPQVGSLGSMKLRLADLVMRNADDVIELVGRNSEITALSPVDKSELMIQLWNGDNEKGVGFEVIERDCWEQVRDLVKDLRVEDQRVSLLIEA